METLFRIFQLPIVVLNFFGFIISGIWLLVLGQWRSVVVGFLISMVAPFVLGVAILPGMIFHGPTVYFAERRVIIGVYFFGFLSSVYIYTLITAWCTGVTFYFLRDAPSHAFWPLLIWSYGVANVSVELHGAERPVDSVILLCFLHTGGLHRNDGRHCPRRRFARQLPSLRSCHGGRRILPHAATRRGATELAD